MDFSKVTKWTIGGKEVKVLTIEGTIYWQNKKDPFYIEDISGGVNEVNFHSDVTPKPKINVEYSTDTKIWNAWSDPYTQHVTIPANGKLYMRGTNNVLRDTYLEVSGNCNIGGDLTTLLVPEGNVKDLTGRDYCFAEFFLNIKNIINAKDLILPSKILSNSCYEGLFQGCSSMVTPPKLPAEVLAPNCYQTLFGGCGALTTAPKLNSTQLADTCYSYMFVRCKSLINPPALPATTLKPYCYFSMFQDCSSLTTAPALPANKLIENCYYDMFGSCSKLNKVEVGATSWNESYAQNWLRSVAPNGTITKPKELVIPTDSVSGVPTGWTTQDK